MKKVLEKKKGKGKGKRKERNAGKTWMKQNEGRKRGKERPRK